MLPITVGLLSALSLSPAQASRETEPTRIVFVCEKGSVKSVLARLLLEEAAEREGLELDIVSRGVRPDDEVPAWFREKLGEDGRGLGEFEPIAVSPSEVDAATYLVTFDVSLPFESSQRATEERWDGLPSVSEDYAKGRDAIQSRVDALLAALKRPRRR